MKLSAVAKIKDKVLGEYPSIGMDAELIFYRGRSLQKEWALSDGWVLGLRVTKIYGHVLERVLKEPINLLPALLVLKKGLTIPLLPLVMAQENQRPIDIKWNEKKLSLIAIESENRCGPE